MNKTGKGEKVIKVIAEYKIQLLITLISLAIGAVNFLIASRLSPVVQDIALIRTEAQAREERIVKVETSCQQGNVAIWEELYYIRGRLDKIYDKVK